MSDSISDRGWFSYRYAVPGFVFIIFALSTSLDAMFGIKDFPNFDVAAFAAILTFFSGPAIGFVITQSWYLLYRTYI